MPKSRSFYQTKKHHAEQARKFLFGLYRKIKNLDLPIDCQLKLFDKTTVPILTYGSEVWGYGDLSIIKKVHTDFMKYILDVKKSTTLWGSFYHRKSTYRFHEIYFRR